MQNEPDGDAKARVTQAGVATRPSRRAIAIGASIAVALAVAGLALETPLGLRVASSLVLAVAVPGLLGVVLAMGPARTGEGWLERVLLAGGIGVAVAMFVLLGASMAPGGVGRSPLIAFYVALDLLLVAANLLDRRPAPPEARASDRRLWLGLLFVVALGAVLRLSHLGYSEFQGDESRVMLRAGEALAGMENALLVHQKGPGEILLSATFYGLDGWVDEAAARLPFALANLWAVAAFFLLAWRLLGAAGGITAGGLIAIEGYLLAFGRIVQYQSIVVLVALLVLLLLEGARRQRERVYGRFVLVGLLLAGGMLAHYDIVTVAIPAAYLVWLAGRGAAGWPRVVKALLLGAVVAGGVALAFYVPYVRYPGFASTWRYVTEDRLGGGAWPYNNLADVTRRTMLYDSSYSVLFLAATTLGALVMHYRRALGWAAAIAALALSLGSGAVAYTGSGWLTVGGRDLSGLLLSLVLLGVCLLPGLRTGERVAWLWFAPLFAGALFGIALPDTHVYVFVVPWLLVVGAALQRLWESAPRVGRAARPALAAAGASLLVLFAIYPWLMFADAPVERLRTWRENRPTAYWYPWELPPERGIFGFPLRNGWKTVAAAYADGAMEGGFEYNTRAETASWYTRAQSECPADSRYWILTDTVEPNDDDRLAGMRSAIEQVYGLAATAMVDGAERLRVYETRMPAAAPEEPAGWSLDARSAAFDRSTRLFAPARPGRVRDARPQTVVDARFGEAIVLKGYTLNETGVSPGAGIPITLTWETKAPVYNSYTVFLHVVDPATNGKAGQRDSLPVCGQNPTWQWNPGDVIEDPHLIPIDAEARPGDYRLYAGLYDLESGARVPVLGVDGAPIGDFVDLTGITVR